MVEVTVIRELTNGRTHVDDLPPNDDNARTRKGRVPVVHKPRLRLFTNGMCVSYTPKFMFAVYRPELIEPPVAPPSANNRGQRIRRFILFLTNSFNFVKYSNK